MFQHKSFNPKVIIVDHFDDVKNQIDIRTETFFDEKSHILSENRQQFLNKVRQTLLDRIDQVKEKNLSLFTSYNDEEAFKTKWSHVIESDQLEFEHKIESLKEDLLTFDCIVISDEKCALDVALWITPWYFNEKSLGILR
jgi:Rad3-related DNA helicase